MVVMVVVVETLNLELAHVPHLLGKVLQTDLMEIFMVVVVVVRQQRKITQQKLVAMVLAE
jgi:hypothetical protein